MRVKKLGVLLLMAAIFAGSMLAVGCDALEDAVDDAKDKLGIAGEADAIEYFSAMDIPSGASDLEKKAYYFADPFYAYKTGIEGEYKEQEDGKYTIIDVVGVKKVRKFMPIKIYFSDYMKYTTFSNKVVKLTDSEGEIPGIYLLTFQWKQVPDIGKFAKIKPNEDGIKDLISAADEMKDLKIPKKSMVLIIPFRKAKSTPTLTVDGKNLLDVQDNPIKGKPVVNNDPVSADEQPAGVTVPEAPTDTASTDAPADVPAKPGATTVDESSTTCELTGDDPATVTETEPAASPAPPERVKMDDGKVTIAYSGNAGLITIDSVFLNANKKPNFVKSGREFGKQAAFLATGELYYWVSDADQFCAATGGGKQDPDKKSNEGKESSMTANLTIPAGATTLTFDYFFISAEVNEWCYANTNYNDEVVVTIAPGEGGSGQPLVQTIETQAQYAGVKSVIDSTYEMSVKDGDLPSTFGNWTNDKTFGVCADPDNLQEGNTSVFDPKQASFDISDFSGTINVTISITDVGDSWNTSCILVDGIQVK